ncbi:MAG TPA: hypothetical protein VFB55_11995 [Verrucomicrobiae bacterium]|nr:hypothetical protein [Verrucomicrobiae bacterium]
MAILIFTRQFWLRAGWRFTEWQPFDRRERANGRAPAQMAGKAKGKGGKLSRASSRVSFLPSAACHADAIILESVVSKCAANFCHQPALPVLKPPDGARWAAVSSVSAGSD